MRTRTGSTHDDNLGMSLRHTFIDILEALDKLGRDLLLVTDTEVLQVEGLRMTLVCTHLCPLILGRIAISPLDEVDSLSYPLVHLGHRHHILGLGRPHIPTTIGTLTAYATGQNGYRLHTEVLAELEVLIVAKGTTLVITPGVLQLAACLLRTDGGLPAVGIPEAVTTAMNHATAREAQELRLEIGQRLSQILTQTMALISILRHQRYHVDIHIACVQHQDLERSLLTGRFRREHCLILLPVVVVHVDDSLCQQLRIPGRPSLRLLNEGDTHLFGTTVHITHKSREVILLTSLHRDTVETVVLQSEALPAFIVEVLLDTLGVKTHVGSIVRMNGILRTDQQITQ